MKITKEMRRAIEPYFGGCDRAFMEAAIAAVAPLILEEAAKEVEGMVDEIYNFADAAKRIRALSPTSHTSPEE